MSIVDDFDKGYVFGVISDNSIPLFYYSPCKKLPGACYLVTDWFRFLLPIICRTGKEESTNNYKSNSKAHILQVSYLNDEYSKC